MNAEFKFYLLAVALLFVIPNLSNASWQFVSAMPHGRYYHDAALGPDGKIYVMGGLVFEIKNNRMTYKKYNDGRYSNMVYDPQSDTWQYLEPVPGGGSSNRWMTYDKETKEWIQHEYKHGMKIPNMTTIRRTGLERQGNGVSIVTGQDGIIYWLGGMGQFEWVGVGENVVFPYDPLNRVWKIEVLFEKMPREISGGYRMIIKKDIPDMLERRINHRAVVASNGKIYVLGGYRLEKKENPQKRSGFEDVSVLTHTVECYSPDTNKWVYKKSLPFDEIMLFAATIGPDDRIYVFGGAAGWATERTTPILNSTVVYDPKTDSWSSRGPMPAKRHFHDAVLAADGKIYILGGSSEAEGPPLNDVFIYDPLADVWTKGPGMQLPRGSLAAVATPDGKIYAIGGTDVGAYESAETLNRFLPRKMEAYTGIVQDTVEVLDISK